MVNKNYKISFPFAKYFVKKKQFKTQLKLYN